jgi:hypothetical protein
MGEEKYHGITEQGGANSFDLGNDLGDVSLWGNGG